MRLRAQGLRARFQMKGSLKTVIDRHLLERAVSTLKSAVERAVGSFRRRIHQSMSTPASVQPVYTSPAAQVAESIARRYKEAVTTITLESDELVGKKDVEEYLRIIEASKDSGKDAKVVFR